MGSHSVTCHPTQVNSPIPKPCQTGWYSIYITQIDGRLSWPRWLVTYRDGLHVSRQSPIQEVTGPAVEQLRVDRDQRVNHYTTPPPNLIRSSTVNMKLSLAKQAESVWRSGWRKQKVVTVIFAFAVDVFHCNHQRSFGFRSETGSYDSGSEFSETGLDDTEGLSPRPRHHRQQQQQQPKTRGLPPGRDRHCDYDDTDLDDSVRSVPSFIAVSNTLKLFGHYLKTHYFQSAYPAPYRPSPIHPDSLLRLWRCII